MNQSELLPSRKPGILQRSSVARPDDRQAMDETASTFSFPSAILFIRYPRVYVLVDAFNDAYRADLFAIFCKKYRNLSGRQAFDVFRFVRCSPGDHYQSSFAYNLRDIEMKWVSMLRVLPGNSSSGLVIRGDRYRWFYRGCCPSDVLHRCFCPSTVEQRKINEVHRLAKLADRLEIIAKWRRKPVASALISLTSWNLKPRPWKLTQKLD